MELKYHFTHLKSRNFNILKDKTALEYLTKWSMRGELKLSTFCFNETYQNYQKNDLIANFFQDPVVLGHLNEMTPNWPFTKDMIKSFHLETVPCTVLTMEFFDKILNPENGIVRNENGELRHCVDDVIEGFMIADELRRMLIDQESINYGLYNEHERNEFIFRIFQHLSLGGQWCQFEDTLLPYLNLTKMLYKDTIRVARSSESKQIEIKSVCLDLKIFGNNNKVIYPAEDGSIQNFAYLIIDPLARQIIVLTHQYGGQF